MHLASMIDWRGEIAFSIVEASEEHVRARMPVTPGILNPLGMVHAGAMIWFADVTATRLAIGNIEVGADGKCFQFAIDLHAALVGNQPDGELFAEGCGAASASPSYAPASPARRAGCCSI